MGFFRGITRQVFVMGWVSFFTDLASEMLYPIIPLFLTGTLGLPKEMLGMIEGIAEGISTGLRWIGGVLSDIARKRKPFVLAGYTLSALSKPIMGLAGFVATGGAGAASIFLAGRASDRLGKSIRTAARDALIADATEPAHRGAAFGLHRAMDTCGAVFGPGAALLVLLVWPRVPLAWLFILALLPGLVSSLLVALFVKDAPHAPDPAGARAKARLWQSYPPAFWRLLAASALFSLGNSSDTLLLLRATEVHFGAATTAATLTRQAIFITALYMAFNAVYALAAAPAGRLSDRLPRKAVIAIGWAIYTVVYAGVAAGGAPWTPWLLLAAYGLYQAFTEGITKAYVTDLVPPSQRAGAIGLYYTIAGFGQLLSSLMTGYVWQHWNHGAAWAFGLCAALAAAGIPALAWVPRQAPPTSV